MFPKMIHLEFLAYSPMVIILMTKNILKEKTLLVDEVR